MHDNEPDRPPVPPTRIHPVSPARRWRALGVLSAAALLLHAAALGGLEWAWPAAPAPVLPAAGLQVRLVEAPAAAAAVQSVETPPEPVEAMPPAVPSPLAAKPPPVRTPSRPIVRAAAPKPGTLRASDEAQAVFVPAISPPQPAAAAVDTAAREPATPPTLLALNVAAAPAEASAAPDDETIPHYRTQMPPPMLLRYEVLRGALRGTGDLVWRPAGDRYELKLDARVSGLPVLTQRSGGGFDAAGLAPERFTDQRLGRGTAAANFQRQADKITYSGAAAEFPLRAGAQDRLSWMIQLAAIVAADARLARPGARVVMQVTGSHGDAGVWSFRCVGPEAVATRAGSIEAVKFVREPREAYDTTVQVWLAPQQHGLPVRAVQKSGPKGDGFELQLLEAVPAS